MFTNVLVGVDGRQGGRDALALAKLLTAPGTKLTLAHVHDADWQLGRGAALALPFEREEAKALLERERSQASVEAELVVCGPRPVGRALHELAEQIGADLIVVGSSRHALLGRVLMGDDCRASLDGASCAVAVAPRGFLQTHPALRTIGVGYDGSPESAHALQTTRQVAAECGAAIKAFHVVSLLDVREEDPLPADWPEATEVLTDRAAEELGKLEGVEGVVTYGGPREDLVRLGKDVDLLIVGSRSYGPVGRLFHGSVSRFLACHAPCPLLVLPRSAVPAVEAEPAGDDVPAATAV